MTVTNLTGEDRRLLVSARWVGTRSGSSQPVGAACSGPEDCADGQTCLGAGEGQIGFCTSSCSELGQLRCDQTASLCVAVDEANTEAYCFNSCDAMTGCGGDHLECFEDGGMDDFGNSFGICSISAATETPADDTPGE